MSYKNISWAVHLFSLLGGPLKGRGGKGISEVWVLDENYTRAKEEITSFFSCSVTVGELKQTATDKK